jgi:hypothetical protein
MQPQRSRHSIDRPLTPAPSSTTLISPAREPGGGCSPGRSGSGARGDSRRYGAEGTAVLPDRTSIQIQLAFLGSGIWLCGAWGQSEPMVQASSGGMTTGRFRLIHAARGAAARLLILLFASRLRREIYFPGNAGSV